MKVTANRFASLFLRIPGRRGINRVLRSGFLVLCLSFLYSTTHAAVFPDDSGVLDLQSFDHLTTGFPLSGAHQNVDCEACHVGGVFEELSTLCVSCHDGVFTDGTPPGHIPVFDSCDVCHSTVSFTDASSDLIDHSILQGQPCANCHDGVIATGKSATHIETTLDCGVCHDVNTWTTTGFDHSVVAGQPCYNCHNGVDATGKSASHISSTNSCEACHISTETWTPVSSSNVDHGQVQGTCVSCHNNIVATGKSPSHINSSNSCNGCHSPGPVPFSPASLGVNHGEVIGACSTCHNNIIAQGKGPFHINTVEECNLCHSTVAWTPASGPGGIPDHSGFAPSECANCHNGVTASGKHPQHINTTDMCDSCHQRYPATWRPVADSAVDHNEVIGVCSSCHNNIDATGKGPLHIPTTAECNVCHSVTGWIPASGGPGGTAPDHSTFLPTDCATCHDGTNASGKNPGHISTTDMCASCHQPFPANWAPVPNSSVDHSEVLGTCSSCHNNIIATGKGPLHIVTNQECDTCHAVSAWTPAAGGPGGGAPDHSAFVPSDCAGCHNGVNASGKIASHINSTDMCASCHQPFPATWAPVASSAVDHAEVIGICASCHNNTVATGKGINHINSTNTCDACHQPGPTPWTPVVASAVDHGHVLGTCINCHNGTIASGKSAAHMPTTDVCDACHQTAPAGWTPVPAGSFNHNEALGLCSGCHDGITATGKGPGHVVTTLECDICHTTNAWTPASGGPGGGTPDHTLFLPADCAGCHNGVDASGKSANHINSSNLCASCHQPFPATWAPVAASAVDHNEVIGTCASCHNNVTASGKPPTHMPSTDLCDSCHNTAPALWLPYITPLNHNDVVGTCVSCHVQGGIATGKSAQHPTTSEACDNCHSVAPTPWTNVAGTFSHADAFDTCNTCHSLPQGHCSPAPGLCDDCHNSTTTWASTIADCTPPGLPPPPPPPVIPPGPPGVPPPPPVIPPGPPGVPPPPVIPPGPPVPPPAPVPPPLPPPPGMGMGGPALPPPPAPPPPAAVAAPPAAPPAAVTPPAAPPAPLP